ncbi:MAG: hypothetical protein F4Z25_07765 [Chloroflexi bacterium]|nr:hypothetical protein [Chloroflexota bacterium]
MSLDTENERQRGREARLQAMRAISKRLAARLREGGPPIDHAELLYDERGLPKGTWVYDDPDETAR